MINYEDATRLYYGFLWIFSIVIMLVGIFKDKISYAIIGGFVFLVVHLWGFKK